MSNLEERWRKCAETAKAIVSFYRSECPEGLDPCASWIAVGGLAVGAAVSAGGSMLAANKQKSATKDAANALQNPTLFEPQTIDPRGLMYQAQGDAFAGLRGAKALTRKLNKFDTKQAIKFMKMIQPSFKPLQAQIGENALSFARGELPSDVVGSITRAAAQQGQQGGFASGGGGASGMLRNLNLRNLGLTSLDLSKYGTQLGMQVNQSAKALLPNLGSVRDWLLSLPQQGQIAQFNTQALNQAGLYNTGLANQAQQANAQGILQSGLTDAAMIQGIGNTAGSLISGGAGQFASGGGAGGINQLGAAPQGYQNWAAGPQPGTYYTPQLNTARLA